MFFLRREAALGEGSRPLDQRSRWLRRRQAPQPAGQELKLLALRCACGTRARVHLYAALLARLQGAGRCQRQKLPNFVVFPHRQFSPG
jgi:hypothetical protein